MLAEYNDDVENPLIWPILEILQKEAKRWMVHHLLAELQKEQIIETLDDDPNLDLFKRNFLIMNALYQLQMMLLPRQWLQVESMDIRLMWATSSTSDSCQVNAEDPLRQYYMNWSNYDANSEEVDELLSSFWRKYHKKIGASSEITLDRRQALSVLGLDENASDRDIRRSWRKMALKWHPDRPQGDATVFRQMCEAWQSLRSE
ncbi:DnaJ domain-containing protein [Parasalinivibrio latis]|uniref:DNA-J related domain-containing protein n=1 Tax=Parasalinivibrio latis TaxID=2952610 RepID=UPI0030DE1DF8